MERRFKRGIVLATALAVAFVAGLVPWGRYIAESSLMAVVQTGRQAVGMPSTRADIDASWRRFRQLRIEQTRPRVARFYDEASSAHQRLLRYAGMDPEHAVLRWGNYDWTMLLSSKVFEDDDEGRSFRFRPRTRSVWLRGLPLPSGVPMFFLVPDGPGLDEAIRGTSATVLERSRQVTNSWGLRGPEPDRDAPLRGIVLGDSYMQGMFLGEEQTPPECLRRRLEGRLGIRASILNTGVMGYSAEQYYHSLVAFADRFAPDFVVVSVFPNDFGGDIPTVANRGVGDWREGKYWLEKTIAFCKARGWPHLIVPVPYEAHLLARRFSGHYPGSLLNILDDESTSILDPFDAFASAHLAAEVAGLRGGRPVEGSPLYNNPIDDHFSAAGAELWAEVVGERILLLLDRAKADREAKEKARARTQAARPAADPGGGPGRG
ncbi:hypothetical protein OJF2_70880 [Aquisphaera giovannonii]|uniref:SGNH hydrolase-type esterase domain-containing protein n=2 Tax=Aquisphaera giovannonii TaxID=406548 RepID=A0A5B9WEL1_9BACT|nr:hypothetical protein OJF2_70880 [Aquisphaera giovannonii]